MDCSQFISKSQQAAQLTLGIEQKCNLHKGSLEDFLLYMLFLFCFLAILGIVLIYDI